MCAYGHSGRRQCGERSFACKKMVQWKCHAGHTLSGLCNGQRPMQCSVCDLLEAQEAEAEEQARKRRAAAAASERRLAELRGKLALRQQQEADKREEVLMRREQGLVLVWAFWASRRDMLCDSRARQSITEAARSRGYMLPRGASSISKRHRS